MCIRSRPAARASLRRWSSSSSRPSRARDQASSRRWSAAPFRKNIFRVSEKGINSVMGSGVLAGFPVVDVKATLIDGGFHDVDSSVLAFEIASRAAFREALREGGSVLLEPDHEGRGHDAGGLYRLRDGRSARPARGRCRGRTCAAMRSSSMRWCRSPTCSAMSISCGPSARARANYTMQFDHYEQVPAAEAAKVQAKFA